MSAIEQLTHYISGLKVQMTMLLEASVGGTLRAKTYEELKMLIKNMC